MLGHYDKGLGTSPKRLKADRKKKMSAVCEARDIFREAWPLRRYGKLDNVFYHAVRFIDPRVHKPFTARRARSIYEGTARRIDSDEMDALRAALLQESQNEARELRSRLAALDEKIAAFDAVTARETMAEGRRSSGRLG